jgi:MFS family permease
LFLLEQIGLTMSGMSIGFLLGPPTGGALYTHFGFRGPFIFVIICTVFDLLARLLVIERKRAILYGHDPASPALPSTASSTNEPEFKSPDQHLYHGGQVNTRAEERATLSFGNVIVRLCRSPRALYSFGTTFIYGLAFFEFFRFSKF